MLRTFRLGNRKAVLCVATQIGFDKPENQDSFEFKADASCLAVSVCDGLGSAPSSAAGSKKAAELLAELLVSGCFDKFDFQKKWLSFFPEQPEQFNATAKFVSIRDDAIFYGGVGDGIIAISTGGHLTTCLAHGEFSNQTSCIYDIYYPTEFVEQSISMGKDAVIIISTDGFSEDIGDDGLMMLIDAARESMSTKEGAIEFEHSLSELLENWPNKTNGDDKTVAFIYLEEVGR